MAVYVDTMRPCIPNHIWRWKESCHLFADTPKELHTFAQSLGLKREWFRTSSSIPHYDLTKSRRVQAVHLGVVQLSNRVWLQVTRRIKIQWAHAEVR